MTLREDQLPPQSLWLAKKDGQWPIYVFETERGVIAFLEESDEYTRRAWKVVSYELGPQLMVIRHDPVLAEVQGDD